MPTDEKLDTEINDEAQSDDSRDEAEAPKSDHPNSQIKSYNFDTNTIIVGLQILPEAKGSRQVLITAGIKGEPPIVVNTTLNQITQSTVIVQALEQLKQALPQIAQSAAKRAIASKTFNTIIRQKYHYQNCPHQLQVTNLANSPYLHNHALQIISRRTNN